MRFLRHGINSIVTRIITVCYVILTFLVTQIGPFYPHAAQAQSVAFLPPAGSMLNLTSAYQPAVVAGMTVFPQKPFEFDFIIDAGDDNLAGEEFRQESSKLIKYFLAALTTPESDLWVNLSPYEQDRIIADRFSQTEMGRDLLAQDYILKQLMASLMYPEDDLGAEFWKRVKDRLSVDQNISAQDAINTFNKVWIVPERASVYIHNQTVFVTDAHLKVMLEDDYLSLRHHTAEQEGDKTELAISKETIREVLIPELEYEVNHGKHFAPLRQIFQSMILASWYKKNLKDSILSRAYVNQNKVEGINDADPQAKEHIYNQYLEAFKLGVYDFIREEYDPASQQVVPRKYFSGGVDAAMISSVVDESQTPEGVLRLNSGRFLQSVRWQADTGSSDSAQLTEISQPVTVQTSVHLTPSRLFTNAIITADLFFDDVLDISFRILDKEGKEDERLEFSALELAANAYRMAEPGQEIILYGKSSILTEEQISAVLAFYRDVILMLDEPWFRTVTAGTQFRLRARGAQLRSDLEKLGVDLTKYKHLRDPEKAIADGWINPNDFLVMDEVIAQLREQYNPDVLEAGFGTVTDAAMVSESKMQLLPSYVELEIPLYSREDFPELSRIHMSPLTLLYLLARYSKYQNLNIQMRHQSVEPDNWVELNRLNYKVPPQPRFLFPETENQKSRVVVRVEAADLQDRLLVMEAADVIYQLFSSKNFYKDFPVMNEFESVLKKIVQLFEEIEGSLDRSPENVFGLMLALSNMSAEEQSSYLMQYVNDVEGFTELDSRKLLIKIDRLVSKIGLKKLREVLSLLNGGIEESELKIQEWISGLENLDEQVGQLSLPIISITDKASDAASLAGKTILVVDDDRGMRYTFNRVLRSEGVNVVLAEDGQQALELLRQGQDIDLVFTDLQMPRLSGDKLIDIMRVEFPDTPVVMQTAADITDPELQSKIDGNLKAIVPKAEELPVVLEILERALNQDQVKLSGKTILVVDDDSTQQSVLNDVLEVVGSAGIVLIADNGEEALRVLREKDGKIDVVLTDLKMPGMTGSQLARKMKTDFPNVPVVLHTSDILITESQIQNEADQNLSAVLRKPVGPRDLVDHLVRAIDPRSVDSAMLSFRSTAQGLNQALNAHLSYTRKPAMERVGSYQIVTTPWRREKPVPSKPFTSVTEPFDADGFYFGDGKFPADEILWEGDFEGFDISVVEQKWPYADKHFLLLPERKQNHSQILTERDVHIGATMVNQQPLEHFRLAFNSLKAGASVKHLHLHGYTIPDGYSALESSVKEFLFRYQGSDVLRLKDYPVRGLFFTGNNFDTIINAAYAYIKQLQTRDVAHSVVFTPEGVYVVPVQPNYVTRFGNTWTFYEISGFILKIDSNQDIDDFSEDIITKELRNVSLTKEQFEATYKIMHSDAAMASGVLPLGEYIERLNDDDPTVRRGAAEDIGEFYAGNRQAVFALIAKKNDPNEEVREYVAEAIGKAGREIPEATSALIEMLDDEYPEIAGQAARGLGFLNDSNAISALRDLVNNDEEDYDVLRYGIESLRLLKDHGAVDIIREHLESGILSNPFVLEEVGKYMMEFGENGDIPAMVDRIDSNQLLYTANSYAQESFLNAIFIILKGKDSLLTKEHIAGLPEELREQLKDALIALMEGNGIIREIAVRALSYFPDEDDIRFTLISALEENSDTNNRSSWGVRVAIVKAMENYDDRTLADVLREHLEKETEVSVINHILFALGKFKDKQSKDIFIRYLNGENSKHRRIAAKSIGAIAYRDAEIARELIKHLEDPEVDIQVIDSLEQTKLKTRYIIEALWSTLRSDRVGGIMREKIVNLLANIGSLNDLERLINLIDDQHFEFDANYHIRLAVLENIGLREDINQDRLLEVLEQRATYDRERRVLKFARDLLEAKSQKDVLERALDKRRRMRNDLETEVARIIRSDPNRYIFQSHVSEALVIVRDGRRYQIAYHPEAENDANKITIEDIDAAMLNDSIEGYPLEIQISKQFSDKNQTRFAVLLLNTDTDESKLGIVIRRTQSTRTEKALMSLIKEKIKKLNPTGESLKDVARLFAQIAEDLNQDQAMLALEHHDIVARLAVDRVEEELEDEGAVYYEDMGESYSERILGARHKAFVWFSLLEAVYEIVPDITQSEAYKILDKIAIQVTSDGKNNDTEGGYFNAKVFLKSDQSSDAAMASDSQITELTQEFIAQLTNDFTSVRGSVDRSKEAYRAFISDYLKSALDDFLEDKDLDLSGEEKEGVLARVAFDVNEIEDQELFELSFSVKDSDAAMIPDEVGGIDLNPNNWNIESSGADIRFDLKGTVPIRGQSPEMQNIQGITPVIINITPVTNLPLLLGLSDENESQPYAENSDVEPLALLNKY